MRTKRGRQDDCISGGQPRRVCLRVHAGCDAIVDVPLPILGDRPADEVDTVAPSTTFWWTAHGTDDRDIVVSSSR